MIFSKKPAREKRIAPITGEEREQKDKGYDMNAEEITNKIIQGDVLEVLKTLPDEIIDCCITSPPYWGLRDYGVDGQIGLERTPEEYVKKMVDVFMEVRRVLKKDATLWLNLGDSYAAGGNGGGTKKQDSNRGTIALKGKIKKAPPGLKQKDIVGIPWMVAFALRSDGWYLRQDIIWHKPNPMPESVTDRCTKSHEYVFLLSKSPKYYFDHDAIKEKAKQNRWGGKKPINTENSKGNINGLNRNRDMMPEMRNKRSVWSIPTKPFKEAHFATFPEDLIIPMVKAGCPKDGIVLDPFMGAGTTGLVAKKLGRSYIGIELNPAYIKIAEDRIKSVQDKLF